MSEIVLITPEVMLHRDTPYARLLTEAGFEVRYPRNPHFARGLVSEAETIDELQGVSATLAGGECYTPAVLAALPQLRVIARCGVGYDRVDIPAATQHNIAVTITPTANHEAVAEHMLVLMLGLAKRLVVHDRMVRAGGWRTQLTDPIRGRTLGLFGLGRIGRSVAVRARALGMHVIATEMLPNREFVQQHQIELVDFDSLLRRSDFLSLHSPLTPETLGLFNRETFAQMKPGSYFINTARGGLVVEEDLVAALREGHLQGAALDVFQLEPPDKNNPLFELDNVILTPHIASADTLSLENMGLEAARSIVMLKRGEWPDGAVVNGQLQATWKW